MEEDEEEEEGLGERVCVVKDSVSRDTKRQVAFPSIVGSFASTVGLFFLSVLAVLDVQKLLKVLRRSLPHGGKLDGNK
jgi:hypothetical protein